MQSVHFQNKRKLFANNNMFLKIQHLSRVCTENPKLAFVHSQTKACLQTDWLGINFAEVRLFLIKTCPLYRTHKYRNITYLCDLNYLGCKIKFSGVAYVTYFENGTRKLLYC